MPVKAEGNPFTASVDPTTVGQITALSFRETVGGGPLTVTIKKGGNAGTIIWEAACASSGSYAFAFNPPLNAQSGGKGAGITVAGAGTCSGSLVGF